MSKRNIMVATRHGLEGVAADVVGDWAIHASMLRDVSAYVAKHPWTVTHVPTGYLLAFFSSRRKAQKGRAAARKAPPFTTIHIKKEIGARWFSYLQKIGAEAREEKRTG